MSEVMQLATLGRHFQLGMLYDCRSDTLIPGVTLWDVQTIQSNLNTQNQPSTEIHIITLDSMENKATALNVSGSLKASLIGGLVEVKGSAKYLNDTKGSKRQARVTLQYKTTTRYEQLTMSHFGRQNVTCPTGFEEGSATHVITAVLYGAQAFFVFDRMVSAAENLQDIQGNMETTIKHLPKIVTQGEASLNMTEEQKCNTKKFRCTFYGDFPLKNNPTTFQDAIHIYATLPSLLGSGGEHSVPMKVWLYPLSKLDPKAAQLAREISVGLVSRCQQVLEQISEAVMRSNDMMNDSVAFQFPEFGDRITQFNNTCLEYKLVFQKKITNVLPSIRGGREQEGLLVDILNNMEQSPFRHQSLITWLDDKEREMMTVKLHLRKLKDIPVLKSLEELRDQATDYVVCFTFTSLYQEDVYLSEAINYLRSHTDQNMQTPTPADGASETRHGEQWFNSQTVCRKMKEQSQLFLDFATANRAGGKIKFLVSSMQDDSKLGASIYLYKGGTISNRCFEPPSQPERPVASGITHNSVTLQLQPPRYGADEIVGYRVEYQGPDQEEWTTLDTPDKSLSFTISGLQPNQEYNFRYRAVANIGVSKVSDSIRSVTRPTGPRGELDFQGCSPSSTLFSDSPSQIAVDVKTYQCKIDSKEGTDVTSNTEGGIWKESHSNLHRIKSEEMFADAARGEVLIEIENEQNGEAHKLCREAVLIVSGNPSIYKLNLQRNVFDQSRQLVKCSFGNPNIKQRMKTIVVMGATGAGKTTLINAMINYILGVEWENNFRYMLIQEETGKSQAESQTSSITAYQLHHQERFKIDYSLTVIDTPGFGDTRGISRDQQITDHIREFFTSPQGVDQIDAVCFVAQASLARLTHTQKYVFDSILSIFGKDIAENIQILVTFADGQISPILEALKVAEVPCPKEKNGMPLHFKFNNSATFAQRPASGNSVNKKRSYGSTEEEEDDYFNAMFWKMGVCNMKEFFRALSTMESRSLSVTQKVLKEGNQREAALEELHIKIRGKLTELEELQQTQRVLKLRQTKLDANGDFEYEIKVTVAVKKDISGTGFYANNCWKCHFTCHDPCIVYFNILKYCCSAMDWWGNCKVCPQKCSFTDHVIETYRYDYETKMEKRTYRDLKERYGKARGEKLTQGEVMEMLEQEFLAVQGEVLELIEQLLQKNRRSNPLSTTAYIDCLIQSEEAKPEFMERIQSLRAVKKRAELREKSHQNAI
ncbi:uncharacterized protein LOC127585884 [Pristis pectinata]|uniref:uncharacterized protein LOC127585884 n=1 Tax=Pristis pectinata TaxID=685728 RepID=UPI00223C9882|nr:uncharacterized protein LOC127585884 [Pristis pectinata]